MNLCKHKFPLQYIFFDGTQKCIDDIRKYFPRIEIIVISELGTTVRCDDDYYYLINNDTVIVEEYGKYRFCSNIEFKNTYDIIQ